MSPEKAGGSHLSPIRMARCQTGESNEPACVGCRVFFIETSLLLLKLINLFVKLKPLWLLLLLGIDDVDVSLNSGLLSSRESERTTQMFPMDEEKGEDRPSD